MTKTAGFKLNEKNTMAPTFISVAKQDVKLGDIKLDNTEFGTSALMFLSKTGATADVTPELIGEEAFAAYPTAEAVFIYANPDEAGDWEIEPGWYLWADYDDTAYPMNDIVTIKKGQGFLFDIQDANLKVTYSGEVDQGEEGEIALPYNLNEKNVMGNVTPVPLTLGDIALNNTEFGTSALMFLSKTGATADVTPELIGEEAFAAYPTAEAVFIYANPDEAGDWEIEPGWYLWADYDDTAYPMNDIVKLPAGQAFLFDIQDAGLVVTLPSPVKPAAK